MEPSDLIEELREADSHLNVERVSSHTLRITTPTMRDAHDTVVFAVTEHEDGWTLSDGGQLAYLLDDDFSRVVDVMECAGALFESRADDAIEFEIDHRESLADAIRAFSYYLAATPVVWHALDCLKSTSKKTPSVEVMAKETKSHLVQHVGSSRSALIRLAHVVRDHGESFPAPLAVAASHSRIRPPLVASFIDATAPSSSLSAAKRNSAFLWTVIRDWDSTKKYVVVRGGAAQVEHFGDFYDERNITTVSTDDYGPLYEDTEAALEELVP